MMKTTIGDGLFIVETIAVKFVVILILLSVLTGLCISILIRRYEEYIEKMKKERMVKE